MSFSERKSAPHFTQPVRQVVTMLIIVGLVVAGAWFAYPALEAVVLSNPYLNGVILGVFVIGVVACFWQLAQLVSSVGWIEGFAGGRSGADIPKAPPLLAPLAALLRERSSRSQLSASSTRSILDSVATRIEEARDITRYIVNLLIFLGLLGTFYGLATTVPAVVDTIRSLAPQEGDSGVAVFDKLMTGLEAQLGGMGTAFSSSLIGLAGSLVVGLLELFAGHGQNRFYRELEEWLSSITRLGMASGEGDFGSESGGAVAADLADQVFALRDLFERSEISRALADERIAELAGGIERLVGKLEGEAEATHLLSRIAEGQERLVAELTGQGADPGTDPESRMRLRSIDVQLLRILEEMSVGRQESLADLRADLAQLTRAIRQLGAEGAEGGRRRL